MSEPHLIVLFGATGDLAKRKLLPGLLHLLTSGLVDDLRIIGVSRHEYDDEAFRGYVEKACREFSMRPIVDDQLSEFLKRVAFVSVNEGPELLAKQSADYEAELRASHGSDPGRLHYLSVPPNAALSVIQTLQQANLLERSKVIMEKPFGTDLASARALNASIHEVLDERQIYRIDHFLGKEAALNILAFRFANGLFEPIWNRNFIDHVQIDVPETLGLEGRAGYYEGTGAFKDMVVTHLFQVMAFMAMEPPTSLDSGVIGEEKNKVFRSMKPLDPGQVVRGQYVGYRDEEGVDPDSETETFVAVRAEIDNWRWADVPFFLRTGKAMAEGARIISIAFREPPKSMFPGYSGFGVAGPDHITFDLADTSRMSLSYYGKRPGPGMRLQKLSMQFDLQDTGEADQALEAYERLLYDATRGQRKLFTTAEGIERLWEVAAPLLERPPALQYYEQGTYGPESVEQLIAPRRWRLPFQRKWREAHPDQASSK
ncbi:MAG TPA: glucose-6-phosphate dehydrogenase [Aeromicrobium sp.]|nr:glucose-6-phosphate dehydrogenase [Aeromicrobium sp.]